MYRTYVNIFVLSVVNIIRVKSIHKNGFFLHGAVILDMFVTEIPNKLSLVTALNLNLGQKRIDT